MLTFTDMVTYLGIQIELIQCLQWVSLNTTDHHRPPQITTDHTTDHNTNYLK